MAKEFVYKSRLRQINRARTEPLTQEKIASAIGVTRQTVIRWMSDEPFLDPDMRIASDLAILFGLESPLELLEPIEKRKKKRDNQQAPVPQTA